MESIGDICKYSSNTKGTNITSINIVVLIELYVPVLFVNIVLG